MKDTTFILVRGLEHPVELELQEIINESVKGLKRKIATDTALDIAAAMGQEVLCDAPLENKPDTRFIFLANKV